MVGIIIADEQEVKYIEEIDDSRWRYASGFKVQYIDYKDQETIVILSGVGVANAAAATQLAIQVFQARTIFNIGSAGTINKNIPTGTIVTPQTIEYGAKILPWKENDIYRNWFVVEKPSKLYTFHEFQTEANKKVPSHEIAICDMEAAGVTEIAHNNKIACGIIKVVSDVVGESTKDLEALNEHIAKCGKSAWDALMEKL